MLPVPDMHLLHDWLVPLLDNRTTHTDNISTLECRQQQVHTSIRLVKQHYSAWHKHIQVSHSPVQHLMHVAAKAELLHALPHPPSTQLVQIQLARAISCQLTSSLTKLRWQCA